MAITDEVRYIKIFLIFLCMISPIKGMQNVTTNITFLDDTGVDIFLYCEEGVPLLLADDSLKKCLPEVNQNHELSCPKKFWCHVGATQNSYYCCPRSLKERCHLAPANGYGNEQIRRFWYDWKSSTCKQLTYTGFGGNENNFMTKEDCEKACLDTQQALSSTSSHIFPGKSDIFTGHLSSNNLVESNQNEDLNPCELTPEKGINIAGILPSFRWYFDIAAARCIRFNYLGSAGNANNFENDRLCLDVCGSGEATDLALCFLPVEPGIGPYKIPRFYFDAQNRACKQFTYTGKGGNNNRFISYDQCWEKCFSFGMSTAVVTTALPVIATVTVSPILTTSGTIATIQTFAFPLNFTFDFQKFKQFNASTATPLENPVSSDGFQSLLSSKTSAPATTSPFTASQTNIKITTPTTTLPSQNLTFILTPTQTIRETISTKVGPGEQIISFNGSSDRQNISLNPNFNPKWSHSEATAIIDAISKATSEPCLHSLPNGFQVQYCSPSNSILCPRGTFCQIGAEPQKTFCCPMIGGNPCLQPRESGIGLTPLGRWYYDSNDNQCKTFIFNGYKGNENNFLTFRACQQSCGATNPCKSGDPVMQTDLRNQCSPDNIQSCPLGYYCRVLDDLTKTVCCPGTDHMTSSSSKDFNFIAPIKSDANSVHGSSSGFTGNNDYVGRNMGHGGAPLSSTNGAFGIVSPIESVSAIGNGFAVPNTYFGLMTNASKPNHYIDQIGIGENPIVEAFGNIGTKTFFNSYSGIPRNVMIPEPLVGSGPLTDSSTDSIDMSINLPATGLFVPRMISNGSKEKVLNQIPDAFPGNTQANRCLLPLELGTGTYSISRYYFDTEASLCRPFSYAGFGGNSNNFETLLECRMACPEYDNPCPFGTPFIDEIDGSVAFCTAANPLCPSNYWCHIGDRRQTTLCCPSNAGMVIPNIVPLNPGAQFPAMNVMQNFAGLGLAQDPGIPEKRQNDVPPTISLACFQPMLQGRGQAQLYRYYFNSKTRTCDKFTYSGKGGNQNNFLSKSDCEEECPVMENPCENGFPAIGPEGNPVYCGGERSDVCGVGYYCHIGATPSTTVCCPSIGDPCRMPVSSGNGNAVLNRWYYNAHSQVCVSFVYTGKGGNSNNFRTHEDCATTCPEFRNPCPSGRPHISLNGQITRCGATGPSICPTTYWCHIGGTLENSVCCPGAGIPCEQKLEIGNGNEALVRFYYDLMTRSCQQFQYSGLGGNENNFMTLRDCEKRCPVLPNPCAFGQPQLDGKENVVSCGAADISVCNNDYFCHIGDTEQTTVCCPGKSKNVCNEPRIPGTGRAHLNRYAYVPLTKQCLPFIYTGLGGNENNFLSRASCEAACPVISNPCAHGEPAAGTDGQYLICSPSGPNICPTGYWCHVGADIAASLCCPGAQNPCNMPLAEGSGNAAIPRWYFDRRLRQCATFTYTGYGGNQNNFQTMQECQEKCPELQNPCSTGEPAESPDGNALRCGAVNSKCPASYFCHIGASPDTSVCCPSFGEPCLSPLVMGTGTAALNRWYFDQHSQQCLQFTYTGSGGNENNFLTPDACEQKCPVLRNPCPLGSTTSNLSTLMKCSARNGYYCPATYWCHIGGNPDSTVCCPGATDPCQLPLSQGLVTDNELYTRWFYDRNSGFCRPFQYTGIGGNQNNFLTRNDCANRCPEGNPVMVMAPMLSTNLPNICPSGSAYRAQDDALLHCSITNPCPPNYFCHIGADISTTVCCKTTTLLSPCTLPVQIGYGTAYLKRVYYNTALRQCMPFIYSGLGGNENNFLSTEECATKCINQEKLSNQYAIVEFPSSGCNGVACNHQGNAIIASSNFEFQDSADSNNSTFWDNGTLIEIQPASALLTTDSNKLIEAMNETIVDN